MRPKNQYTVSYTRDESSWTAQCVEVPGCITQGRTIEQARTRMREAIQAWFDLEEPYAGTLRDDLDAAVPSKVLEAVESAREASELLATVQEDVTRKQREAALALLKVARLGLRDAGEYLGVSRQRVHQIVGEDFVAVYKDPGHDLNRLRSAAAPALAVKHKASARKASATLAAPAAAARPVKKVAKKAKKRHTALDA